MGLENLDIERLHKINALKNAVSEAMFDATIDLEEEKESVFIKLNHASDDKDCELALDEFADAIIGRINDILSDSVDVMDRKELFN